MARKSGMLIIAVLVIAFAVLYAQGFLPFATTGEFTLASFELDDYGEYWYSGSPLAFGGSANSWVDDQGKFAIQSFDKPFVNAQTGALEVNWHDSPVTVSKVAIKADVRAKDIKVVFRFPQGNQPWLAHDAAGMPIRNAAYTPPVATIKLGDFADCVKTTTVSDSDYHLIEWRSSNLREGYGAMFYDGIKVCEKQLAVPAIFEMSYTYGGCGAIGGLCTPNLEIWGVGQRLPFNCRIDTSHEAFFVERFAGGEQLNLNKFAFEPVAFCKDSPVVRVASQPVEGVTSSTEPFLRWAEGKTLAVPEHEVWLVTYVADWKRSGLSSGCAAYDRYLVDESKCESEARIVIAKQQPNGEVRVDTLTETGTVINEVVTPSNEVMTLDEAPAPEPAGNTRKYVIYGAISLMAILAMLWWARRLKGK